MNRSSIHITALALALALYVSDSRAQQRTPPQSTPPSTTSPSTGPQTTTPPSTSPRSTSPSATQRQSPTSPEGTISAQAFVQQLYEDNQKEIEVSRMANTKAQAKEVKDYAKQLVDDHTKSQDKLRKYAMEKNITLRSSSTSSTRSSQDTLGATSPSTTRSPSSTTQSGRDESSTSTERSPSSTSPSTQSGREPSTASTQSGRNEPTPGTRRTEPSQGAQTGRSESTVGEQHEAGSARAQSDTYADSHIRELSSKSGAEFDRAYVQMMVDDHQKAAAMLERQKNAKTGDSDLQGVVNDQLSMVKKHLNKAEDIQKNLQKDLNSTDSKSDSKSDKSRTPSSNPSRTPSTNPSRTPSGPSTR